MIKRSILIAAIVFLPSSGFCQLVPPPTIAPQPSDQEIAEAHTLCDRLDHRVPFGSLNNRPPDAGQYKPEWKARCEAIDAEHDKRGLAAKAKQADDQKRLDSIIGRIK